MSIAAPARESQVPTAASSSWRTWLMTGIRQGPIYRRRVRGAHKGLKRMLVEGMGDGADGHTRWRGFSGAMVRQAVAEAVGSLPPRQRQLIKLAYFSDLSNREGVGDMAFVSFRGDERPNVNEIAGSLRANPQPSPPYSQPV